MKDLNFRKMPFNKKEKGDIKGRHVSLLYSCTVRCKLNTFLNNTILLFF